jgi:teichuronic acid biosynthesis glycosyltransferase TuaC
MDAGLDGKDAASLHVLTLTPFYPSLENEVAGCFVKEPLDALAGMGVASSVIAVTPVYNRRQHPAPAAPARWMRYFQFPGTTGLASAGRFLSPAIFRSVAALHRKRSIDLIHAHAALPCGHAASFLSRRLKIPYVVTVHGLDVFNSCFRPGAPAEWRRRASISVYANAANVVCVSGRVQQILQPGMPGGVRSAVVYNGTDTELFSPAPVPDGENAEPAGNLRPEILVVGNLIPSKGQELVLRAIHRLVASFPELQCRIIGEGPDRASLETLAGELGIRPRVHFVGRQNRAAVADALRRCTVFALPSRSEGLGCVYLEAMACARPVIACRGQGIEEIVEHQKNGLLVSPGNLDELQQSLATLFTSPALSRQIGEAARRTILNGLTLTHQAQNLATIYRQACMLAPAPRAL